MHCRPSCTQGFVPSLRHLHLLATATSHQQQSHQPAETGPRLSVHLLGLRRKLCSLGVGSNAAGTRTCLTVTGTHISVISLLLPLPPPLWVLQAQESKTHTSHHQTRLCVFPSPWHRNVAYLFRSVFSFFCVSFIRLSTSHFVGYCQKNN